MNDKFLITLLGEDMNERELMRLAESLDEFSASDYTVEDLKTMSGRKNDDYKRKYFDYYDDVKDKTLKRQDW